MSDFVEILSKNALEELKQANAEVLTLISNMDKVGQSMKKVSTPSGANGAIADLTNKYKEQEKTIASLQKQLIALEQAKQRNAKSTKTETQLILDQAKSYQSLTIQKDKAIAQAAKEEQSQLKLENAYERVKAKIASTLPAYNDLKTKSELGIKLNKDQERQLALLEGRLVRYREVLNTVNKSYGNYTLEVGNYAKGTSNLTNAIGQISRELPNFGQSFQVGILSLTNNVGALLDGVKQVRAQNTALKAEGKATTSVLSQIGTALFSWQTALFVGIGLLSAYSKEIADFTKELFGGNKALEELTATQQKYNKTKLEGTKSAVDEITEVNKYLAVIKDRKLSDDARLTAFQKLQSQYPYYFKNLKTEQDLLQKGEGAINSLLIALNKKNELEQKTELSNTTKKKILDLEEEIKANRNLQISRQKDVDDLKRLKANSDVLSTAINNLNKAKNDGIKAENTLKAYKDADTKYTKDINGLKKETILLEYSETKVAKEKVKSKKEQEKYDENSIKALENQIKALQELQDKVDASSYAYSLLDFQVKLLENTLKAMKGEFNSSDSIIKPEMVIDGDAVALEIDKVKRKTVDLSKELETILNDAYGYTNELGQSYRGFFDGLTQEQKDNFNELVADYAASLDSGDAKTAESLKLRIDMYKAYGMTIAGYEKSFFDSFTSNSGFQNTFKILNKEIVGFGENAKVTALAVTESFQEMFNFINQFGQENFDAQRQRLEEETNIALAFAGDSQTAKDEINRQAEQKRKEIQRREFKAKKEMAIFNIAIDTAQAIMATYGQAGFFGGIAGAAIIAAIGAAQIAMVQAQEVPAYKTGTDNHKGGAMLVNDGSGSNYKETIQTPDGKIYQPKERNVIMNAPKGTKVFTHDQWQRNLDNILTSNSINYAQPNVVVNSGMSDEQVNRIVSTIANKQEAILSIDKNGWNTSVRNGHSTKQILNNQVTFGR